MNHNNSAMSQCDNDYNSDNLYAQIDHVIDMGKDRLLRPDRPGDPRFGPTHHPLIAQTKQSKQV